MTPYYIDLDVTLYHGDAREILPGLPSVPVVITDPPYSTRRKESAFNATTQVREILAMASEKARTMLVFGTSSARGIEFVRTSVTGLQWSRILTWHRSYVNSPAAGPWRWDTVLIHVFGRGCFGRPQHSSLVQTDGTQALARATGHPAPVPTQVMEHLYRPFAPGIVLDPFAGAGATLLAAKQLGGEAIGIEIDERHCESAAERLRQTSLLLSAAHG